MGDNRNLEVLVTPVEDLISLNREVEERVNRYAQKIACSVRSRMDELNMSSAELAERMRVKPSYVSRLLSGSQNITLKTLVKIGIALDIPVEQLLS